MKLKILKPILEQLVTVFNEYLCLNLNLIFFDVHGIIFPLYITKPIE